MLFLILKYRGEHYFNDWVVSKKFVISVNATDGKWQVMFEIQKKENASTNFRDTISYLLFSETCSHVSYIKFWY